MIRSFHFLALRSVSKSTAISDVYLYRKLSTQVALKHDTQTPGKNGVTIFVLNMKQQAILPPFQTSAQ